ncbi:EcsC family protein [Oligoflexia bacterium]|nr:EcsC family protein [Oligoflexia bacterium]
MDREYVENAKLEIEEWESQKPGFLNHVGDLVLIPAQHVASRLIPGFVQSAATKAVQKSVEKLSGAAQLISDEEEIQRYLEEELEKHKDELRAADEVARHYWNWNIACGIGEGGATGALGLMGLAADIPALLTLSLRSIQQVGRSYGYDMQAWEEREYAMHILRVGSASSFKSKMEFLVSLKHVEQVLVKVSVEKMGAALAQKEIGRYSLLGVVTQFAEKLGVHLTRRKALQMVPIIGAVVGASFNAVFVNDVGQAAYMLYRRRRIAELEGPKLANPKGGGVSEDEDVVVQ